MSVLDKLRLYKRNYHTKKTLLYDVDTYASQYSTSIQSEVLGYKAARDILVCCHVVEKGLSHKNLKPLFGLDRVSQISSALQEYISKGGRDSYIINMAISTLEEYNKVNSELGVTSDKLIKVPDLGSFELTSFNVGVDRLSKEEYFSCCNASFSQMCEQRHSVRLYDAKSEPITETEIIDCIRVAQNCPSACNRQAVRIKIITKKDLQDKVCEIQGGSKGFGENAGAVLIITSDISLYEPSERRMPMLDCGLFIMKLVYAFYERQIGTCVLNGSFNLEREKQIREVAPIPDNEMYAAVIALSKIPDGDDIRIAHSVKRDVKDIVKVL